MTKYQERRSLSLFMEGKSNHFNTFELPNEIINFPIQNSFVFLNFTCFFFQT